MSISDFEKDQQFPSMIGTFLNDMITQHGFTFEEAYAVAHGEIMREYDQRIRERRASFKLVETSCEARRRAKE